jgi:hypothetical protein
MQVLDDGSHLQLAPDRSLLATVAQLVQPQQLRRLTEEQAEVLAIVISDGMATRRLIEEARGATQLSIGPDRRPRHPKQTSETLVLLLSESGTKCGRLRGEFLAIRPVPKVGYQRGHSGAGGVPVWLGLEGNLG